MVENLPTLVRHIDWDTEKIIWTAHDSSVEIVRHELGTSNETLQRVRRLFREARQYPFHPLRIVDSNGDELVEYLPPLEFELMPNFEDYELFPSPEPRLNVRLTPFISENSQMGEAEAKERWSSLVDLMRGISSRFRLRFDPDSMGLAFPSMLYARGVSLRHVPMLEETSETNL